MKKKILALSLALGAFALILSAGTMAYFSDKDTKTNTFTLGKVDITLTEKKHDGSDYEDGLKLMPGSAKTTAIEKNALVTVDDKSEDAWVWVEILIPSALYNSKTETNENNNGLHYNQLLTFLVDETSDSGITTVFDNNDKHQWSLAKYIDEVTVGAKTYSRLRTTHKDIVKAGETTSPAISQVYLDDDVKFEDGKYYIPAVGASSGAATSFVEYTGDWEVIVNAYAVQAEGFATVDAAVAAYK